MGKLIATSILSLFLFGCAAPQPASCDGKNLRPINQQHTQEVNQEATQ